MPPAVGKRLTRRAALEQQQNARRVDAQREEARRVEEHGAAEHVDVEAAGDGEIVDVERGLEDAGERRRRLEWIR